MSRSKELVQARLQALAGSWTPPVLSAGDSAPSAAAQVPADPIDWPASQWFDAGDPIDEPAVPGAPIEHVDPDTPVGAGPLDGVGPGSGQPAAGEVPDGPQERHWTPASVAVLVLLVAAAIAGLLAWNWWHRPRPVAATDMPALVSSSAPSDPNTPGDPNAPALAASAGPIVVHVAGDVRHPGLVELPANSRVADAIKAAGGLARGGELGATNLARPVVDGERIEVGVDSQPGAAGPGGAASPVLDLNSATAQELDQLPGVGPVTAGKILAWRAEHGRFTAVEELAEVPGIGPKTLAELRPLLRVGG